MLRLALKFIVPKTVALLRPSISGAPVCVYVNAPFDVTLFNAYIVVAEPVMSGIPASLTNTVSPPYTLEFYLGYQ